MLEVNDEICRILGYERHELLQMTWAEITHPDDLATDIALFNRVVAGEMDSYSIDKRWIRKDGQIIDSDISVKCVRRADNSVDYFVALLQDVTERKRADEKNTQLLAQVQHERKRLDTILSTVPGVVWEAWGKPDQATQRIDFVSDYVEPLLGYTVQEWISVPNFWLQIVHPDDQQQTSQLATDHLTRGKGGVMQFRWVAKDGRVVWVESNTTVILSDDGKPLGMRGVNIDITLSKQMGGMRWQHPRRTCVLCSRL